MSIPLRQEQNRNFWSRAMYASAFAGFLCAAVAIPGCSNKDKSVSGTVTMNGAAVAGIVVFECADGKKIESPIGIGEGKYAIINPPPGAVKSILITPMPGVKGAPPGMKDKTISGVDGGPKATAPGVAPPDKYGRPDNGLTYTVTDQSTQTFNITLKE